MVRMGITKKPVDVGRLKELCAEGRSLPEIAVELGVSTNTIYSRILMHDITYCPVARKNRKDTSATAAELYAKGVSVPDIAEQLGLSTSAIYYRLRSHGVIKKSTSILPKK